MKSWSSFIGRLAVRENAPHPARRSARRCQPGNTLGIREHSSLRCRRGVPCGCGPSTNEAEPDAALASDPATSTSLRPRRWTVVRLRRTVSIPQSSPSSCQRRSLSIPSDCRSPHSSPQDTRGRRSTAAPARSREKGRHAERRTAAPRCSPSSARADVRRSDGGASSPRPRSPRAGGGTSA
jgi:hypothetical protein